MSWPWRDGGCRRKLQHSPRRRDLLLPRRHLPPTGTARPCAENVRRQAIGNPLIRRQNLVQVFFDLMREIQPIQQMRIRECERKREVTARFVILAIMYDLLRPMNHPPEAHQFRRHPVEELSRRVTVAALAD